MPPGTPRSPATLHDVAREAGVSLATASRSLNGSTRRVNEEYRARVVAAAERLGYIANFSAQAIAKGMSPTVALVVSDIADPYFSSIASGVMRGADESGLLVTMAVTERSAARELGIVKSLRGQRPRVLILTGSRFLDSAGEEEALTRELAAYEESGGRVVVVAQQSLPFDTVQMRNYEGARDLARALADRGNRRFAAITGSRSLLTSADRLQGFRDGLAESGIELPDELVVAGEFTRDGGYAAAGELLERGLDGVDVVFAVSDVMAIGTLSRLRDAGVDVPGRIGVAGFDDIATAADVTPALTTVRLPLVEMGRLALEMALREREDGERQVRTVGGAVLLRASTR
ncbi:LacI family DNA-binding transcriptional regulator [Naasia sp. SYSU D00057]|uniref:LacI family DNA-binding transcriptional regulator n=1 Tax=Naasia sp. SYSU D00057 TaxID=2817380 RepID=UPI001B307A38|nr:LacI family DNA-binding transcriptional regulator [Naasia sp. SYSU D00057]